MKYYRIILGFMLIVFFNTIATTQSLYFLHDFSLSKHPGIYQETKATFTFEPGIDENLMKAKIILPPEAKLISGDTVWTGSPKKDQLISFYANIMFTDTGNYKIIFSYRRRSYDSLKWFEQTNNYYLYVGENSGFKGWKMYYNELDQQLINEDSSGFFERKIFYPEEDSLKKSKNKSTINVNGFLKYYPNNSTELEPAIFVSINLYKNTINSSNFLGSDYTDEIGEWNIQIPENLGNIDLKIEAISLSYKIKIYNSAYGQFTTEEPFKWYASKSDVNVGTEPIFFANNIISGSNSGAMRIYQTLLKGYNYCPNEPGTITAEWSPYNSNISGFNQNYLGGGPRIYFSDDAYEYEYPILHEEAHHIQYNINQPPEAGCPGLHHPGLETSLTCAWSEGWAEFFPHAVTNSAIMEAEYGNFNIEEPASNQYWGQWGNGEDEDEGRVAGALWDLYDYTQDGLDLIGYGFSNIWDIIYTWDTYSNGSHDGTYTLPEFWEIWKEKGHNKHYAVACFKQNTIDYNHLPVIEFQNNITLQGNTSFGPFDLWSVTADQESSNTDLTFSLSSPSPDFSNFGVTIFGNQFLSINPVNGWTGSTEVTIRAFDLIGYGNVTFTLNILNGINISGYIIDGNNNPINNVTVTFSNDGGSTITNSQGFFSHAVDVGWSGNVTPNKLNYIFIDEYLSFSNVQSDITNANFTGIYNLDEIFISGYITDGVNPISDVIVSFTGIEPTSTNEMGFYSKNVISGWGGTITPSKDLYSFEPIEIDLANVTNDINNQDFTGSFNPDLPNADFTNVPENNPGEPIIIYQNGSIIFSDNSTSNSPITGRVWNFTGGDISISYEPNPTVSYSNTGTFETSLTVFNSDGSDTKTKEVQVNPDYTDLDVTIYSDNPFPSSSWPVVNFSVLIGGGPPVPTPPYSYYWDFDDGNTSNSAYPNHSFTEFGIYNVTLTVVDNAGMMGSDNYEVDYHDIIFTGTLDFQYWKNEEPPQWDGEIVVAPDEEVNFQAYTNFSAIYNCIWQFGDGSYINGNTDLNIVYTYEDIGLYPVYLWIEGLDDNNQYASTDVIKLEIIRVTNSPQIQNKWIAEDLTTIGKVSGANCTTNPFGVNEFDNPDFEFTNGWDIDVNSTPHTCEEHYPFAQTPKAVSGGWYASHGTPNYGFPSVYGGVPLYNGNNLSIGATSNKWFEDGNWCESFYSEGLYYQLDKPLNPGNTYYLKFMGHGRSGVNCSSPFNTLGTVVDHVNISITNGLQPFTFLPDPCPGGNEPYEIFLPPTYPFSLHKLGLFHSAVKSSWDCFELWFTPPSEGSFDQIWIYPESIFVPEGDEGGCYYDWLYIDNLILKSESNCNYEIIFENNNNMPDLTSVSDHIIAGNGAEVLNNQNVAFQAENYILLQDGFVAHESSEFIAYIDECTTGLKSSSSESIVISNSNTEKYYPKIHFDKSTMNLCGNPPSLHNPLNSVRETNTEIKETNYKLITISPNPTKGQFKIQVSKSIANYDIELLNMLGGIIYRKENIQNKVLPINIFEYPNGIYIIKVKTKNKTFIEKIIKQ